MQQLAPTQEFLGVTFTNETLENAAHGLLAADPREKFRYVITPNVQHMVSILESRNGLPKVIGDAWRVYCDSRVLRRLARFKGTSLTLVTGSDLTPQVLKAANERGLKVVLIGPTNEAAAALGERYPRLDIVSHCPPHGFMNSEAEIAACVDVVVKARAPLVFLAVGAPRQELLAHRIAESGKATGIGLCIGASIDFLTGKQRRAPVWMQRAGIEWLYRLMCEPYRLASRYLIECPRIFYLVLKHTPNRVHS